MTFPRATKCGALGGLKMNLTCCLASSDCMVGCKALKELWSSFSPPLKFVPWSDRSSAGFPWREMNLRRAIRNESWSRLLRTSIWTAWMVRHLNSMPHRFSFRRPILTVKSPKQSMPVEEKDGFSSRRRAGGRSAICGTAGFALHLRHSRQACWCRFTASLPRRIQYF